MNVHTTLDQFVYAFGTMTALLLPLSELPVFLAIMKGRSNRELRRGALTVAVGSLVILATAAVAGRGILQVFGVSFGAFRAAGGLVLIVIGLEMLKGHSSLVTLDERVDADPEDRLWIPLIMPLTAGPAAITAAITLSMRERTLAGAIPVGTLLAILAATGLVYVTLLAARPIAGRLSARAARLGERFLGLVLVAVGFQMGLTGIWEFFQDGPSGV